jgi:hypothetical protein
MGAERLIKQFIRPYASTLAFQLLKIEEPDALVKSLIVNM